MDKRLVENLRVKKGIEDALFKLLQTKKFSEITVSDLVSTAGVARASYYRNYENKEAVIESYMARQREDISKKINFSGQLNDLFMHEKLTISLSHYLQQKDLILSLYDNGFGTLILEESNKVAEDLSGDMPLYSIKRYNLYFLTGAMFNMTIQWLKNGAIESTEEMAGAFIELLNISGIDPTM